MSKHARPTKSQVKRIADQCGISIGRSDFGQYPTLDQLQQFGKAFIAAERDRLKAEKEGLLKVATLALAYIDAIPKDTVLPAMPGFDRDWADGVIAKATAPD